MIFAHLPAGYLLGKLLAGRTPQPKLAVACAMAGSILPDLDFAWDWLIDPASGQHRHYITHTPIFWIAVALAAWATLRLSDRGAYAVYVWLTLASVLICHLFLDTVSSGIHWLYPWSNEPLNIIRVPWTGGSWMASYFAHWSFGFELALITLAAGILGRSLLVGRRRDRS